MLELERILRTGRPRAGLALSAVAAPLLITGRCAGTARLELESTLSRGLSAHLVAVVGASSAAVHVRIEQLACQVASMAVQPILAIITGTCVITQEDGRKPGKGQYGQCFEV
jgi:hypothetical protein